VSTAIFANNGQENVQRVVYMVKEGNVRLEEEGLGYQLLSTQVRK